MRDTFKKILAASTLTLLIALPLGAQATDKASATNMPATVKEASNTIVSVPLGIDGNSMKGIASPFITDDNNVYGCTLVCYGGVCWYQC